MFIQTRSTVEALNRIKSDLLESRKVISSHKCLYEYDFSITFHITAMVMLGFCVYFIGLLFDFGDAMASEMCFRYYHPSKQIKLHPKE